MTANIHKKLRWMTNFVKRDRSGLIRKRHIILNPEVKNYRQIQDKNL